MHKVTQTVVCNWFLIYKIIGKIFEGRRPLTAQPNNPKIQSVIEATNSSIPSAELIAFQ